MAKQLTAKQREILDFIADYQAQHGYPPTRADIGKHFAYKSPNAAESHLRALEKKGAIQIQKGVSRGILLSVARPSHFSDQVPLIGRVAAGSPVLAQENIQRHVGIDPSLFDLRPDYLLRVQGDSMLNAGINNGDWLAVHRQRSANNGTIVIARIEDEVTVKRLYQDGTQVTLVAENDHYPPIEVNLKEQEFALEGIVVGVIRKFMS